MPYQRASGCRLLKEATSGDIVLKRCIHFRVQNQQMLTLFLSYKMHLDHMQSLKCSSLLIPLLVSSLWSWRRWALRAHPWVGRWTENWALQKAHPPRGRALHAVLCCCTGTKTMGKAQTGHKDLEHLGVLLWSEIGGMWGCESFLNWIWCPTWSISWAELLLPPVIQEDFCWQETQNGEGKALGSFSFWVCMVEPWTAQCMHMTWFEPGRD